MSKNYKQCAHVFKYDDTLAGMRCQLREGHRSPHSLSPETFPELCDERLDNALCKLDKGHKGPHVLTRKSFHPIANPRDISDPLKFPGDAAIVFDQELSDRRRVVPLTVGDYGFSVCPPSEVLLNTFLAEGCCVVLTIEMSEAVTVFDLQPIAGQTFLAADRKLPCRLAAGECLRVFARNIGNEKLSGLGCLHVSLD